MKSPQIPKRPKGKGATCCAIGVSRETSERLTRFCKAGSVALSRAGVTDLALTRLLDQLQDNPANLFK